MTTIIFVRDCDLWVKVNKDDIYEKSEPAFFHRGEKHNINIITQPLGFVDLEFEDGSKAYSVRPQCFVEVEDNV
jgi:hypothetical protein